MNANNIRAGLKEYNLDEVEVYINYLNFLINEKKKGGVKNPWMKHRSEDYMIKCFKLVKKDNLEFDGKHITLQSTGVSYDYIAYKNKMISIYPESLFDVQLVREGDKFRFTKESGHVTYQHEITNPFGDSNVIGAYCIIKNKRGEFLTAISRAEIDKHRKVAKTDFIWLNWFNEMVMKTVIKKACKTHFADAYQNIDTMDNEQYDIEQPLGISIKTKQSLENIKTLDELTNYYKNNVKENSGVLEDFTKACADRKKTILEEQQQETENADS